MRPNLQDLSDCYDELKPLMEQACRELIRDKYIVENSKLPKYLFEDIE